MKSKLKIFILSWITSMVFCGIAHLIFTFIVGDPVNPIIYLIVSMCMIIAFVMAIILVYIIDNFLD